MLDVEARVDDGVPVTQGDSVELAVEIGLVVGSATHHVQFATASAVAIVPLLGADTEMVRRCAPLTGSTYDILNQASRTFQELL